MKTNKIFWIDFAKGLGIILVVYGHVARGIYYAGLPINSFFFNFIDKIIYSFHVPLFFFISGIFFLSSLKKYKLKILNKKIKTVLYPYFLWSLLQGSIMIFLSKYTNQKKSFRELLNILFMPIDQFWFLYTLFLLFLVSTLIFYLKKDFKYVCFVFLISIIVFIFQEYLIKTPILWFILHNLVFFVAGIFFSFFISNFSNLKIKSFAILLIFFLFLQLYNTNLLHLNISINKFAISLIITFVSIFIVIMISFWASKLQVSKIINILGENSLEIYVTHILAASGIRIFLNKFFGIENIFIHLSLGVLAGLSFPFFIKFLLKDNFYLLFKLSK